MIFNLYKFTHLILKICIFEYFIDIKCQTGSLSYFLPPPQAPLLLFQKSICITYMLFIFYLLESKHINVEKSDIIKHDAILDSFNLVIKIYGISIAILQ
jgi:hypothetical protein